MSNDNSKPNTEITLRRDDSFMRALEPTSWESALQCGAAIHKAGIGGVKSAEDAVIRMMAGREIGLGAMASLRLVYSINGKVGYDAALIRARCLQHPECRYFEPVEVTTEHAIFRAKRGDRPEHVLKFTLDEAKTAKLADKDVWKAYPKNMLAARATVNLARLLFPEAVAGMHTPDELAGYVATDPAVDPTPPAVIDAVIVESSAPPLPDFAGLIESAGTPEELAAIAKHIEEAKLAGRLPDEVRKPLAKKWAAKNAELTKATANGAAAS